MINISDVRQKRINEAKENRPVDMTHIKVLLFTGDEEFSEILSQVIRRSYDMTIFFLSSIREEDLLEIAKNGSFDIFIIALNNIKYNNYETSDEQAREGAFHLVSYLRSTYKKPIIALYGYPDDPAHLKKVKSAGASFVFNMPFKLEPFLDAFRECLKLS